MEKVSIIIPVYNTSGYVERCLQSVKKQSYKNIQVVIVNDGSTDDSNTIIQNYIEKNGLGYIYLEKENGGLSSARNHGMNFADGDYLFFLDSDDYLPVDAIEKLINASANKDIIIGNFIFEDAKGITREVDFPECQSFDGADLNNRDFYNYFYGSRYGISACNKLYRRRFVANLGVLFQKNSEIYAEDLLFNIKLFKGNPRVQILHKGTYVYFQNNNSITHSYKGELSKRFATLINDYSIYNVNDTRMIVYTIANAVNSIAAQEKNLQCMKTQIECFKSCLNKSNKKKLKDAGFYLKGLPWLRVLDYRAAIAAIIYNSTIPCLYQLIKKLIR